jgi:hypothetical protein
MRDEGGVPVQKELTSSECKSCGLVEMLSLRRGGATSIAESHGEVKKSSIELSSSSGFESFHFDFRRGWENAVGVVLGKWG